MAAKRSKKKHAFQTLKGFRDILPEEQKWWDFVEDTVEAIARENRFFRMRVPVLEEEGLFVRSVGEDTDIVGKEMYSFEDPGERRIALRPEFTAGFARAFIEHGMHTRPQPLQLFDIGPLFRHDRPQAGRFRQFWQFNFEVYGGDDPVVDAQLVYLAHKLYSRLGIPVTILVNSIGNRETREEYKRVLVKYFRPFRDKLPEEYQKRITKNPLRILDSKDPVCQEISQDAPQIIDWLDEESKQHFMHVLEFLDDLEVNYALSPRLVRGLDYYNRTVFEVVDASEGEGAGSQAALGGGGRYDFLVEQLGGRPTPAVGFAGGIDRVIDAMKRNQVTVPDKNAVDVFVAQLGTEARRFVFKLVDDLVASGIRTAECFSRRGLKSQLEYANKLGVKFTLILGQKEILDKTIIIRDMESGIQEIIDRERVVSEIRRRLEAKKEDMRSQEQN